MILLRGKVLKGLCTAGGKRNDESDFTVTIYTVHPDAVSFVLCDKKPQPRLGIPDLKTGRIVLTPAVVLQRVFGSLCL
jgi:hypothetical protein